MSPLFEFAPVALGIVVVVGAATAFFAATIGCVQNDIKRVIAYSTCSQLGYMFFALGVGAYPAAIFHLMTHAFFKSLLFLSAGSVIHAMSDEQDMRNMGGLWKHIKLTYAMMWIGSLALAGVPIFAGYYSKDIILEATFASGTTLGMAAYVLGIAAAFMTAFYSWRLLFLTFHGKPRANETVMAHVHESPPVMTIPLVVLAVGAVFSGMIAYDHHVGDKHRDFWRDSIAYNIQAEARAGDAGDAAALATHEAAMGDTDAAADQAETSPAGDHDAAAMEAHGDGHGEDAGQGVLERAHHLPTWIKKIPLVVTALGIALAFVFYIMRPSLPGRLAGAVPQLYQFLLNKWYFDELYDRVFVRPAFALGRMLWKGGDGAVIDGFGPDGMASLSRRVAGGLKRFQSGYVYHYAFLMIIGVVAFVSWRMVQA
jgi:NADH-quinone oxidoreductase subunit L